MPRPYTRKVPLEIYKKKLSVAAKKRWAKVTTEERSQYLSPARAGAKKFYELVRKLRENHLSEEINKQ